MSPVKPQRGLHEHTLSVRLSRKQLINLRINLKISKGEQKAEVLKDIKF